MIEDNKNISAAAEEILIEASLVLDCLDFEVLIISDDFKILFVNKFYLNANGLTEDGVKGRYCYALTHGIDHQCSPPDDPCPIERVKKSGKPEVELHTHRLADNKKRMVYVTAAPAENQVLGYIHLTLPRREGVDARKDVEAALSKTTDVLNVVNLYQRQIVNLKTKTSVLQKTKTELEVKINELENFNKLMIGRELRMAELKKKIMDLEQQRLASLGSV